ncbi:MAG: 3-hydroxyacyl-CoA dehydrogenase [Alphaproteobacteria bacterium]
MPQKVALVGAGLVGRGWAIAFARGGCAVTLYDSQPGAAERTRNAIAPLLAELAAVDLLNGHASETVMNRIAVATELDAALADADHVQENAPEDLAVKRALWADLDRLAPSGAVLASSTSAILPSAFSEGLQGRARCLVAHPINPPYLVPAVEVVPAPWTGQEAVDRTASLMRDIGQKPIVMKREIDGFIMNRMQGVLLEEAFRLVADGYASAEDVDAGIRDGLGLRWAFMGPFETIDLNAPGGVADYIRRYQQIYVRLHPSQTRRVDWESVSERLEAELGERLPRDQLGERQAWRDRRLMALRAHKRAMDSEGDA